MKRYEAMRKREIMDLYGSGCDSCPVPCCADCSDREGCIRTKSRYLEEEAGPPARGGPGKYEKEKTWTRNI